MTQKKHTKKLSSKKRLTKSKDKILSGVCGGIAEYTDTDPTLIRLAWVFITLLTGVFVGIIVYIIAALIMPESGS